MRNKTALLAALYAASMSSPGNAVEYYVDREPNYSFPSLRMRSTAPRSAPKASQAKKRRLARRLHCGHIKNLRLRA